MQAGTLDKRITIQSPVTGQNEYGEPLTGWTDVATVWASVLDITGREFIASAATQNTVETKITIRYINGITTSMRVLWNGAAYNIQAVLGADRCSLLLMCERGVNLG